MKEAQFVESDGEYVVFEGKDGKFRVAIDDSLRAAVRRGVGANVQTQPITPKEIQERVRGGESVSDIVKATKADSAYVDSFARAVFEELEHIVASARSIRISVTSDKFNEIVDAEFGAVIEARAVSAGASNLDWSSKRPAGSPWLVTLSFERGGQSQFATWSFEPRKYLLSPENATAASLGANELAQDGPIPRLRPLADGPVETPVASKPDSQPGQKTEKIDRVIPLVRTETAPTAIVATPEVAEPPTQSNSLAELFGGTASTTDLLDVLAKKRASADQASAQAAAAIDDLTDAVDEDPGFEESQIVEPEANTEPIAKVDIADESEPKTGSIETVRKGRASIPSWDEIVFGTKGEDEAD